MTTLHECPDCGSFYTAGAVALLTVAHAGNCVVCGRRIAPARRSPDPSDPWEVPFTRRQLARAVALEV